MGLPGKKPNCFFFVKHNLDSLMCAASQLTLQMSGNLISTFEAVDVLKPLGSLTCLYLEHNPLYK